MPSLRFGFAELNIFFYFAVFSSLVMGCVILFVIGLSKVVNVGLNSLDFMEVGIGAYLVGFSVVLLWLKRKLYDEFEEVTS